MSPPRVIHISEATGASDEVYIGRAGHGEEGYFGNPYKVDELCQECNKTHRSKGATLGCYERYLRRRIKTDIRYRARVKALLGKTLVCFCKPGRCHGDILAAVVEELRLAA